jgi:drug/metabolite transporter (DMT)-like permease
MNPYLFIIFGSILTGIHIFSIKYLRVKPFSRNMFYGLCLLSFSIWLLSRYFIFIVSDNIPITVIHVILNLSIIVSTILSIVIYKTKINWVYFFGGVVLMLCGVYFVEKSIL